MTGFPPLPIDNAALEAWVDALAAQIASRLVTTEDDNTSEQWRLLDVAAVAEMLGRSARWVRTRARDGSLPYVRLDGGPFAFEADDVREFARARHVDGRTDKAPPTKPRGLTTVERGWDT